jgi:hypothetical protein
VKLKLVQSAIPSVKKSSNVWEKIEAVKKGLESFHKGFSALDQLALLAAPSLLKDKVIVIDDIERKHTALGTDELLGFIDEFTQQHGARFVLILNSDQLTDVSVWDIYREKVIDQELRLFASAQESFDIAIGLAPSRYAEQIRAASKTCGLTNIRVIRKTIRAVNRVLGNRENLSGALLSRVVPSIVLLATVHYKGIEDAPTFDFILSQGTANDWSTFLPENKVEDEVSKRKSKWKQLLNDLSIYGCDEFELLAIEFLQSGLFDTSAVSKIIDRYRLENEALVACENMKQFFENVNLNHRLTDADLLIKAEALVPKVHLIDCCNFTSLRHFTKLSRN